jgi:hypothetical protein
MVLINQLIYHVIIVNRMTEIGESCVTIFINDDAVVGQTEFFGCHRQRW